MSIIDSAGLMAPPWLKFPQLSRYDMFWRMGDGEVYRLRFAEWYSAMDDDGKARYRAIFPAPKGWLNYYREEGLDDCYDERGYLLWNKDGSMKYTLEQLQSACQEGQCFEYVFFWQNKPSVSGALTESCLSQWWESEFSVGSEDYSCAEQYMMSEKARIFGDKDSFFKIMSAPDPARMKRLGRNVKNFDSALWSVRRSSVVMVGNLHKFCQDPELKRFLLQTKGKVLVEASPYDKIWGIGMSASNKDRLDPVKWKGLNLLGFALMEVRDEIERVCANEDSLGDR